MKEGITILKYTPYEVNEFGFKNGRIYISKYIYPDSIQKVFLERFKKGKATLHYYRNKGGKIFFLEKETT